MFKYSERSVCALCREKTFNIIIRKKPIKNGEKESQPNNRWFCNHKNTAKNKSIYNKKEIEKCIQREKS